MKNLSCYFVPLVLLLSQNLYGQGELSPWALEWHYTPQHVDYHAPQRGAFLPVESTLSPGYSFTLGLGLSRQINSRISLYSGLAFFSARSESLGQTLRWGNEHDGNGGFGGPNSGNPSSLSFQEHLYYLQLPLQIQVYLTSGKWRSYIKSGLQLEYLLARRTAFEQTMGNDQIITTHTIDDDASLRPLNLMANLGIGLEWVRTARQSFFLEPEGRISLLGVSPTALYPSRRYDLGIRAGFRLRFARQVGR